MSDDWLKEMKMLSADECQRANADLHDLREKWIPRRGPDIPYYTLGAASTFPEMKSAEGGAEYYAMAKENNPVIKDQFQWVLDRLLSALSEALGAPANFHEPFALPGFQIFGSHPGFTKDGMIHSDVQYTFLDWSGFQDVDFANPLAYTMAIKLPSSGGGLNVWEAEASWNPNLNPPNYDLQKAKEELKTAKKDYIPYEVGTMVLHSGLRIHQVAGLKNPQPDDERISLQGHGLFCDGEWKIFW
ncbi:MAG: hypothetical protein KDN22_01470 [Verrucomicrobiae bacterium]|nr:hypothetical protein [Verrucomicrobiae bacterium]